MDLGSVLVALFIAVYFVLGVIALRRPLLARLALREAVRRPWQSTLLVAGLMTGTAAILAMSIVVDSAINLEIASVEMTWGRVDLEVGNGGAFFSQTVADRLSADPAVRSRVSGVQAGIDLIAGVADLDRSTVQPAARVVGFDPAAQAAFGLFTLTTGRQTNGADLGPDNVLISALAASALDAHPGDRLRISSNSGSAALLVAGIVKLQGAGMFGAGPGLLTVVFAPLASLASLVPAGTINVVRMTAGGAGQAEIDRAHLAVPVVQGVVAGSAEPLFVHEVKADDLKVAGSGPRAGRGFLTSLSVIILIAGTLLVVNLMLALSEERRPRLAVLRALGLSRSGQVVVSVLEGSIYTCAAGVIGILPGLAFGAFMWGRLVANFGAPPEFAPVTAEASSIAGSLAAGTLITLITVGFASLRGSRMSIAAALKELPDRPRRRSRWRWVGGFGLAVIAAVAVAINEPAIRLVGGTVLIILATQLAARQLAPRPRAALLGLAIIGWNVYSVSRGPGTGGSDFIAWVLSAAFVTFGTAVVVTAGYPLLELLTRTRLGGRLRAVLRPPLAYLSRKPVPSALGVSTIAVVLSFLAFVELDQAATQANLARAGGDFDIAVISAGGSQLAIPVQLEGQMVQRVSITARIYVGSVRTYGRGANNDTTTPKQTVPLLALTAAQLVHPVFTIDNRDSNYASDADAWTAMASDPSLVLSTGNPGSDMELQAASGGLKYRSIGSVSSPFVNGIVGSAAAFAAFDALPTGELLLVKTAPGADTASLARELQRAVFADGAQVITRQEATAAAVAMTTQFVDLIELLFTIGLLVGVASIGIVALRAAIERRHTIGVLRALGYQPAAVLGGVLVEALLTAVSGTLIGVSLGLYEGYEYVTTNHWAAATVDWAALARTAALILGAVAVVTILPALQASRLAPAQALRLVD
jgi:putative ABC transport system permease protein